MLKEKLLELHNSGLIDITNMSNLEAIRAALCPGEWTTQYPAESGYYWMRYNEHLDAAEVVLVDLDGKIQAMGDEGRYTPEELTGGPVEFWSAPIETQALSISHQHVPEKRRDCPDCGVAPGQQHENGCDVERCTHCGAQYLMCGHATHDPAFARWTGFWPGVLEAQALSCDLNTIYSQGLHKLFFVKPKTGFDTFVYADLSTKYITPEDGKLIGMDLAPFHLASVDGGPDGSTGDFFWVPLDTSIEETCKELSDFGFSPAFCAIFSLMHSKRVPYVRFDAAGGEMEGAKEFEW